MARPPVPGPKASDEVDKLKALTEQFADLQEGPCQEEPGRGRPFGWGNFKAEVAMLDGMPYEQDVRAGLGLR